MKRAPKGSTTARLLLKLEPDLKASAEDAARGEGIAVSEWWRRAGREKLAAWAASGPQARKISPGKAGRN